MSYMNTYTYMTNKGTQAFVLGSPGWYYKNYVDYYDMEITYNVKGNLVNKTAVYKEGDSLCRETKTMKKT